MLVALQCSKCRKGLLCPEDLAAKKRCPCGGTLTKSPGKAGTFLPCPTCGAQVDAVAATCCTKCGAVFDPRKNPQAKEVTALVMNLGLQRLGAASLFATIKNGLTGIRDFFLPDRSRYQRFPAMLAFLGLGCAALAYFEARCGFGEKFWALPALAVPVIVLGFIWRRSWLALLGLFLAIVSFPECFGLMHYYRGLDRQAAELRRKEEVESVRQAGLKLAERARLAQEAAAKKAQEEIDKRKAEEAARKAQEERLSQELQQRLDEKKAQEQAQQAKEEKEKLAAQKKLEQEEKKKQAEVARQARLEKLTADLETAQATLRDKRVAEDHENHLLTLVQKQISSAREFMESTKAKIEDLENKGQTGPQLDDARKVYKNWQADLEKSQAGLPAAQKAAQKAKDERLAAEKVCDDLKKQIKQTEDEEAK